MELNNNTVKEQLDLDSPRSKRGSVSSASSTNSDTSEDVDVFGGENKKKQSEGGTNDDQLNMEPDLKITRSMSDGEAKQFLPQEFADVFPSLPDAVLSKLGLLGEDVHRARMSEEEIEQKFISLALAFTIDAATIKDRCQRQRRYRDQTENNLTAEIDKLIQKVTCIQPLCVDAHTAELLTGLLAQIDVVIQASYHAAISAERFGAVQHEDKLAEAVNLMISHVSLLKQQRDSVRKQLQYTKKVLQDTNTYEKPTPKQDLSSNNRFITRRRASIATITQPKEINNKVPVTSTNGDIRRILRRSSDLSTRVSALARSSRPTRLELGVDLSKIKEGMIDEDDNQNTPSEESDSELASCPNEMNSTELVLSHKPTTRYERYLLNLQRTYETATQNGRLQNLFVFLALMCFTLSVIILGNILVELEFSKRGVVQKDLLWKNLFPIKLDYFRNDVN